MLLARGLKSLSWPIHSFWRRELLIIAVFKILPFYWEATQRIKGIHLKCTAAWIFTFAYTMEVPPRSRCGSSHTLESSLLAFSYLRPPSHKGTHFSDLSCPRFVLLVLELHINKSIECRLLWICLFSVRKMFSRFIHVVACVGSLFSLLSRIPL